MKTYYIVLERSKQRAKYIQNHVNKLGLDCVKIPAVDGKYLTREDIIEECNVELVDKQRHRLTNNAIGCILSHKLAYAKFLETPETSAFIIEDDAVLPPNIKIILDDIAKEIRADEVILLRYVSSRPADISKIDSTKLPSTNFELCFPVDVKQLISAAAYCVGREAAKGLLSANTPIEVYPDSWGYFWSKGAFTSFRVLYPSPITGKKFKSNLGRLEKGGLKAHIANFATKYNIPIIYHYLKKRRIDRAKDAEKHFTLVDRKSPISQKITSINKI